jgi:hypothetical protein
MDETKAEENSNDLNNVDADRTSTSKIDWRQE